MESLMFAQLVQGGMESIMLWNSVAKKRVDAMEKCSFFAVQDTKHSNSAKVYAVYAGAGLFDIAAVPNGSEYPPEHWTPLCIHCDW